MQWKVETLRNISWQALASAEDKLVSSVQRNREIGYLLVSEPQPTYTFGRFASTEGRRWEENEIAKRGIAIHRVPRGGKWTYHGPGQIVIFPIVHLRSLGFSGKAIRPFIECVRSSVSGVLENLGIDSKPLDEPYGLFSNQKKLVSFGFAFQRGVSRHGIAVYHSSQNPYFQGIYPCGQSPDDVTCLQELSPCVPEWETVASHLIESIKKGVKRPEN